MRRPRAAQALAPRESSPRSAVVCPTFTTYTVGPDHKEEIVTTIGSSESSGEGARPRRISRRRFLRRGLIGLGGTCAAGFGCAAYARWIEPYWIEYHDVHVELPGLPQALDGFTIAHVSDIHCGPLFPPGRVRRVFDRVRKRRPDAVAITGDLVYRGQGHYPALTDEIASLAGDIPTFVVPGNHDYWEGISNYRGGLLGTGAFELTNAHVTVNRPGWRLVVAGVDDFTDGRPDLRKALAGVDAKAGPVVLLMHNPDFFPEVVAEARGVDLVLAGHTHGGQVRIPFVGPPVLPIRHKKYAAGLFHSPSTGSGSRPEFVEGRERGTTMYVSRGVGMIMQLRFNCRPEVAYVALRTK